MSAVEELLTRATAGTKVTAAQFAVAQADDLHAELLTEASRRRAELDAQDAHAAAVAELAAQGPDDLAAALSDVLAAHDALRAAGDALATSCAQVQSLGADMRRRLFELDRHHRERALDGVRNLANDVDGLEVVALAVAPIVAALRTMPSPPSLSVLSSLAADGYGEGPRARLAGLRSKLGV